MVTQGNQRMSGLGRPAMTLVNRKKGPVLRFPGHESEMRPGSEIVYFL